MKNFVFLFSLLVFTTVSNLAQEGKYTPKLKQLYADGEYDKIIKYKKGKVNSFESMSLYYKAMAHYMTKQDKKAIEFFDLAINKGPDHHDTYYYKGMSLYYTKKYEDALVNFDEAIKLLPGEPAFYASKGDTYYEMHELDSSLKYFKIASIYENCGPIVFSSVGEVCYELGKYAEGVTAFKNALALLDPATRDYQDCNYNIALGQQQAGLYSEAKATLIDHIELYPEDYHAIAKLIQTYYANGESDQTAELKTKMIAGYKKGELPKYLKTMYCFDQFDWNDTKILAFESYDKYSNDIMNWKHKFFVQDSIGEIDFKIQTNIDTNNKEKDQYYLNVIKNDTLFSYNHFVINESTSYPDLKNALLEVLNNKVSPTSVTGDFEKWQSEQRRLKLGSLGTSYQNAVIVGSVPEEYEWLRANYPGYQMVMQSLTSFEGKPYDILKIITSDGEDMEVYFDISSFFGKRY